MFKSGMNMHLNSKPELLCRISLEQQWTIKLAQQPWDMERGIVGLVNVPGGQRRSTLNTLVCTTYFSWDYMCEFLLCSYRQTDRQTHTHTHNQVLVPVWGNIWEKLRDEESDLFVCFVKMNFVYLKGFAFRGKGPKLASVLPMETDDTLEFLSLSFLSPVYYDHRHTHARNKMICKKLENFKLYKNSF